MASPFDFSAFLLTPPLPKTSATPSDNNGSNSGNGQNASDQNGNSTMSLNVPGQYGQGQYNTAQSNSSYQMSNSQLAGTGYQNDTQSMISATGGESSGNDGSNQYQQHKQQNQQQQQSASTSNVQAFDERDYGLDPSAFSSVSFALPSFLSGASNPGQFGDGPIMVDPSAFHPPAMSNSYSSGNFSLPPQAPMQSVQQQQPTTGQLVPSTQSANAQSKQRYVPDTNNPVYGIYGSSVISVNPDLSPFKLAPNSIQQAVLANNPPRPPEDRGTTPDFDPKSLGLPVGSQLFPQPLPGLYSSSGFDMLGVLARVVARPNPQINIGPVDTSCSFLVIDARRYDMPIVFASETFAKLTGYSNSEIIGRNCRFLQAPDGHVTAGSRRKYTDGNAVYHLKTHISSGKECQASIINYRKDGSPFINLVTVIPISWDTDEIAYFVGFQVDLVEQPNAILEKMRNGTYVVNYSLLPTNAPPAAPVPTVPAASYKPQEEQQEATQKQTERWAEQKPVKVVNPTASANALAAAAQSSMTIAPELLEVMGQADNASELDDDAAKKKWNKMLLDHTGDFVHVLSLKGSFLYVSPSVKSMLEYEPSDLIGKTLQSVCHPSDIVPVMRELKDSSTIAHPNINLLYRFRRKSSGYVWLEAQGKLYIEQSKSRKCVILVGRERPVYKLSWQDLRLAGGLGEKEFWSKISLDGKFLYNTPTVKAVIGHDADGLRGSSIFELIESSKASELSRALQDAAAGKSVRLHHKLRNEKRVFVDCITNFYPNSQAKSPTQSTGKGLVHPSIIAQTNEYSSEMRRRATLPAARVSSLPGPTGVAGTPGANRPSYIRAETGMVRDMIVTTPEPATGDGGSDSGSSKEEDREKRSSSGPQSGSDSSAPSTFSAIPSTFKTLIHHPSSQNDNVFDELDVTRTTSWQYELHQLKLTNKKLKEELQMLQAAKRKRKKKEELQSRMEASASPAPQPNPANPDQKICANCGRTDSPEWRVGPSGARNLCNACGLRWAKATRGQNRQASATPAGSMTPSSISDMDTSAVGGYMAQQVNSGPFAPRTVKN